MKVYSEIVVLKDLGLRQIVGQYAHTLYFKHLDRIIEIEKLMNEDSKTKFYVFETDGTLRAVQSTKENALTYMKDDRVLMYAA